MGMDMMGGLGWLGVALGLLPLTYRLVRLTNEPVPCALDAIRAGGSADVMREAMTLVLQQLIEQLGQGRL